MLALEAEARGDSGVGELRRGDAVLRHRDFGYDAIVSCPVSTVALGCVAGPPVMLVAGGDNVEVRDDQLRIILSQPLGGLSA